MTIPRYNQCTIWRMGKRDPLTGLETVASVRTYQCEVKRGGKAKFADRTGSEFYPASTFWVREGDLLEGDHIEPKQGEMIAKGLHTGVTNPAEAGAEVIRAVMIHDHKKFGELESYTIGTTA